MKKANEKKYIPLLVSLVIVLWVLIGYRVYDHFADNKEIEPIRVKTAGVAKKNIDIHWSPSFAFEDPFLKRQKVGRKVMVDNSVKKTVLTKEVKTKTDPIQIPYNVSYNGCVINKSTKEYTAILQLENESLVLKKGDQKKDLQLINIYADSVEIQIGVDRYFVLKD